MTLVILAHHFLVRLQQRLNQRAGACEPDNALDQVWETTGQDTTLPLLSLDDYPAPLPPQPVRLSPMQVRLLLRVVLALPRSDHVSL